MVSVTKPLARRKHGNKAISLRNDGLAVACGQNGEGQCEIPQLSEGETYSQVSAGLNHAVLPRSDGVVVACGLNTSGQCDILKLSDGQTIITYYDRRCHIPTTPNQSVHNHFARQSISSPTYCKSYICVT